jgi:hypothetical protein
VPSVDAYLHEGPFALHLAGVENLQALLIKPPGQPWRFGASDELEPELISVIAEDAVRVVTGNQTAYTRRYETGWRTGPTGETVFHWGDL